MRRANEPTKSRAKAKPLVPRKSPKNDAARVRDRQVFTARSSSILALCAILTVPCLP
jgi:hypothetical protein